MKYGYARVSSKEQNLDRQLIALKQAGVEERYIYCDKVSGKDFDRRAYNTLVGTEQTAPVLRAGDILVILSLDRLGRNYEAVRQQWEYITKEIGADIEVLDMPLLSTAESNGSLDRRFIADLVLQILSYVAEKERRNTRERQRQGIEAAKAKGKRLGRPEIEKPDNWESVYKRWKTGEITAVEAMRETGLKKGTFYAFAKEMQ
ncbi:recombinase family protein [Lachnoclostridium edouardi]|uniref:recombinase family protein n=1 Tax=Lachnoclostridium edouardi TaxID=1926283 RepID=UPI000C7BC508|nr:recombinase family protein [Lachnoclostridium edouardi]